MFLAAVTRFLPIPLRLGSASALLIASLSASTAPAMFWSTFARFAPLDFFELGRQDLCQAMADPYIALI